MFVWAYFLVLYSDPLIYFSNNTTCLDYCRYIGRHSIMYSDSSHFILSMLTKIIPRSLVRITMKIDLGKLTSWLCCLPIYVRPSTYLGLLWFFFISILKLSAYRFLTVLSSLFLSISLSLGTSLKMASCFKFWSLYIHF